MKICIINNLFPPIAHGGTEAVVQQTMNALRDRGHEVFLVTTQPTGNQPGQSMVNGFKIYRFRPTNVYYYTEGFRQPTWKKLLWHGIDMVSPFDARRVRQILADEKPDLVHGHNLKGMSYGLPAACASLGLPYVHTLHNYQLLHPYGTFLITDHPPLFRPIIAAKAYQAINRRLFRSVKGVISPSVLPLQFHRQSGFFRNIPSTIIPNPVSPPIQSLKKPERGTSVTFTYFGALEEHKGIQDLLAAVRQLPAHGWTLDIYGRGSLETQVRLVSRDLPAVKFHGYTASPDVLGLSDALIYPSRCYETQGLSMAEALIRGTPVIAADIGGLPETVIDGRNGFLYPAGNVRALTTLLARCLTSPRLVRNMRVAALASAARFSTITYQAVLLDFYYQINDRKITR